MRLSGARPSSPQTTPGPCNRESGIPSSAGPSSKKWRGASMCVPVWTTMLNSVTFSGSAGMHMRFRTTGGGKAGTLGIAALSR